MQEQLIELQTQVAFQEQTINELNDALSSQQRQIDILMVQMKLLKETVDEAEAAMTSIGGGAQSEAPPHY